MSFSTPMRHLRRLYPSNWRAGNFGCCRCYCLLTGTFQKFIIVYDTEFWLHITFSHSTSRCGKIFGRKLLILWSRYIENKYCLRQTCCNWHGTSVIQRTVLSISWFVHMVLPSLRAPLVSHCSIFIVISVGKDGCWMLRSKKTEAEQFY